MITIKQANYFESLTCESILPPFHLQCIREWQTWYCPILLCQFRNQVHSAHSDPHMPEQSYLHQLLAGGKQQLHPLYWEKDVEGILGTCFLSPAMASLELSHV